MNMFLPLVLAAVSCAMLWCAPAMAGEPGNGQVNSDLKKHFQSAGHKSKILS
jgi:hypothetical protein